jgi:hypothetical protein
MNATNSQTQPSNPPIHVTLMMGDVVALALFLLIGEIQHGLLEVYNPLIRTLEQAAMITAPWLLLAWLLGAYPQQPLTNWRSVGLFLLRTMLTWLFAAPLGVVVRAWVYQSPTIIMLFVNAALTFGGAFLLFWRTIYALISLFQNRRQSTAQSTVYSILG